MSVAEENRRSVKPTNDAVKASRLTDILQNQLFFMIKGKTPFIQTLKFFKFLISRSKECCKGQLYNIGGLEADGKICCNNNVMPKQNGCCRNTPVPIGSACCKNRYKDRVYKTNEDICCDGKIYSKNAYECVKISDYKKSPRKYTDLERLEKFNVSHPYLSLRYTDIIKKISQVLRYITNYSYLQKKQTQKLRLNFMILTRTEYKFLSCVGYKELNHVKN